MNNFVRNLDIVEKYAPEATYAFRELSVLSEEFAMLDHTLVASVFAMYPSTYRHVLHDVQLQLRSPPPPPPPRYRSSGWREDDRPHRPHPYKKKDSSRERFKDGAHMKVENIKYYLAGDSQLVRLGEQVLGLKRSEGRTPALSPLCESGLTLGELSRRLQATKGKENFVVFVGVNDVVSNVNISRALKSIEEIFHTLAETKGPHLVVKLPLVMKYEEADIDRHELVEKRRARLNESMKQKCAAAANVKYLEIDFPKEQIQFKRPDGSIDGKHLNADGLKALADAIRHNLKV